MFPACPERGGRPCEVLAERRGKAARDWHFDTNRKEMRDKRNNGICFVYVETENRGKRMSDSPK